MIQTLSETVILPIAGVILAIVMTLELIQIITDRNNFHEIETAVFFKWMFKSACAILMQICAQAQTMTRSTPPRCAGRKQTGSLA